MRRGTLPRLFFGLLFEAATDIRKQGILGAFASDAQIDAVGIGETSTLKAFTDASLVIVDDGKKAVRWHVVLEEFHDFPASLDAGVEFRVGFRKFSGFEVGTPQSKATNPGIEQVPG